MSVDLEGYSKLSSYSGTGTGAGNYISVYNTTFGSVTEIEGLALCNSNSSVETFKLWQVPKSTWINSGDWDTGVNVEPAVAYKDRIFYATEIPTNMTIFLPVSLIMQENQYLIFEGSSNVNITIWGKEDPYVNPPVNAVDDFLDLNDTPILYTGEAKKLLQVNSGQTEIEFTDQPTIDDFTNAEHNHSNVANGSKIPSTSVNVTATGFTGNLSVTDTDVQLAMNTIDSLVLSGAGIDTTAIHNNTPNEISTIAEQPSPVDTDLIIIEDSVDSGLKKKVQLGNILSDKFIFAAELLADQTGIITNTETLVEWDSILLDTGSNFSGASAYNWVCPETGYYHINVSGSFEINTNGLKQILVKINGTTAIMGAITATGLLYSIACNKILEITSTDLVTVDVKQVSGVNKYLESNKSLTFFQISKINS